MVNVLTVQVARCTSVISPNTPDAQYVISFKQRAKVHCLCITFRFLVITGFALDCSLPLALAIMFLPLTLNKACALGMLPVFSG